MFRIGDRVCHFVSGPKYAGVIIDMTENAYIIKLDSGMIQGLSKLAAKSV